MKETVNSWLDEPDEMLPDEVVIARVNQVVSNEKRFATNLVSMGCRWFIRITDYTSFRMDPPTETDKWIDLELVFNGPQKGDPVITALRCRDMLGVLANTAKLIEDRKALKWDDEARCWRF